MKIIKVSTDLAVAACFNFGLRFVNSANMVSVKGSRFRGSGFRLLLEAPQPQTYFRFHTTLLPLERQTFEPGN